MTMLDVDELGRFTAEAVDFLDSHATRKTPRVEHGEWGVGPDAIGVKTIRSLRASGASARTKRR